MDLQPYQNISLAHAFLSHVIALIKEPLQANHESWLRQLFALVALLLILMKSSISDGLYLDINKFLKSLVVAVIIIVIISIEGRVGALRWIRDKRNTHINSSWIDPVFDYLLLFLLLVKIKITSLFLTLIKSRNCSRWSKTGSIHELFMCALRLSPIQRNAPLSPFDGNDDDYDDDGDNKRQHHCVHISTLSMPPPPLRGCVHTTSA